MFLTYHGKKYLVNGNRMRIFKAGGAIPGATIFRLDRIEKIYLRRESNYLGNITLVLGIYMKHAE